MKKFSILILTIFFTVNSIAISAWASSCPHDMAVTPTMNSEMPQDMPTNMPCHEEEKQENNHCDGICLCAHIATAPSIMLNDTAVIKALPFSFETVSTYHTNFISFIATPQGPPPKSFS